MNFPLEKTLNVATGTRTLTISFSTKMIEALSKAPYRHGQISLSVNPLDALKAVLEFNRIVVPQTTSYIEILMQDLEIRIYDNENHKIWSSSALCWQHIHFIEQYGNYVAENYVKFYDSVAHIKLPSLIGWQGRHYYSMTQQNINYQIGAEQFLINGDPVEVIFHLTQVAVLTPKQTFTFKMNINESPVTTILQNGNSSIINGKKVNMPANIINILFQQISKKYIKVHQKEHIKDSSNVSQPLEKTKKIYTVPLKWQLKYGTFQIESLGSIKFSRIESEAVYEKLSFKDYILDILSFTKGVQLGDSRDDQYLALLIDVFCSSKIDK